MPENQPITAHASGIIPFDFEFFVVAIPLNAPGIMPFPTTGTYSAFNNLRRANKNHKADNTWRDAVVITERSDDIFPD
ncbi:hypothetical protein ACVXG8_25350 [Escherichia coli]